MRTARYDCIGRSATSSTFFAASARPADAGPRLRRRPHRRAGRGDDASGHTRGRFGRGFYLGHTLSGSRQPVRFNLREGSDTDRNAAILSLGALGSGKTTLDQKLALRGLSARGANHRLRPQGRSPPPPARRRRPATSRRSRSDPSALCAGSSIRSGWHRAHMRQDATVSFLCDLLPARPRPRGRPRWSRRSTSVIPRVGHRPASRSCERCRAGDEVDRAGGEDPRRLRAGRSDPARLRGSGRPRGARSARPQVTYIPIRDLPGPQAGHGSRRVLDGRARRRADRPPDRDFAMQLMSAERHRLKLFSFDEGWRLLGDPVGRMLLASLQRMGRSELAVPIIATQLVSDTLLDGRESLENLIGATFVFGLRSEARGRPRAHAARPRPRRRATPAPAARVRCRPLPDARPPRPCRGRPGRRGRPVAAAGAVDDAATRRRCVGAVTGAPRAAVALLLALTPASVSRRGGSRPRLGQAARVPVRRRATSRAARAAAARPPTGAAAPAATPGRPSSGRRRRGQEPHRRSVRIRRPKAPSLSGPGPARRERSRQPDMSPCPAGSSRLLPSRLRGVGRGRRRRRRSRTTQFDVHIDIGHSGTAARRIT